MEGNLPPSTSSKPALSWWREVRDSADADLQLMRARANSFKDLANSFDRELENFFSTASTPFAAGTRTQAMPYELDFVKKLKPKITELRRVYSAPEISRKVMETWGNGGAKLGIDLSAIKNALASDAEGEKSGWILDMPRRTTDYAPRFPEFWSDWKEDGSQFGDWEPIRKIRRQLRQIEKKSEPVDLLEGLKNNEFLEKLKLSLKAIRKEPEETKDVPPLDVPELLAYLVKQSEPFLDQLGVRRDFRDKIVGTLCSKRRNHMFLHSVPDNESVSDELDLRIASVLESTGHNYEGGLLTDPSKPNPENGKRHVAVVTTASLPWMTGTAVNPLFRAAYLAKSANQKVTLLIPWLCKTEQERVYPNGITFNSPEEQESYIRNWLEERTGFKSDFKITFYPGKFSTSRRSIIPAGDTSLFIPYKEADIAILEEPEHLNWYHHGKRWTDKFNYVVGVVHTNYLEYIKREWNGAMQAFFVKHINTWVSRAYCHKILRLSGATQDLPRSVICNVHGVNPKFLEIGEKVATENKKFSKGAYFLGKMVWAKGYRELIDLLSKNRQELDGVKLDVFGNGEDAREVQTTAERLRLNMNFLKGRDHADDSLQGYKVFINPSVSDVLCTATAEALAMGKFVVCAEHPSNEFFRSFSNCLIYRNPEEFVEKVKEALEREPKPLTAEERYDLSWESATQRFMRCSDMDAVVSGAPRGGGKKERVAGFIDQGLAFAHYCLTGNEFLRLCTGATPGTREYNQQHCKDLKLLPPQVENPIYGW